MTPSEFVYWLQGHFELHEKPGKGLTAAQVKVIKNHMKLVLTNVTRERREDRPVYHRSGFDSHQRFC